MNNNDLAQVIAADAGLSKTEARKLVDDVLGAIVQTAADGEEVSLSGFGKFKVKDAPARKGRNPATGEAMQIAASRKLTFTPAKAVKGWCQSYANSSPLGEMIPTACAFS